MGGSAAEAAQQVLIEHQRFGNGSCGCGWGDRTEDLGKSYCQHVLHELQLAGLDVVWR